MTIFFNQTDVSFRIRGIERLRFLLEKLARKEGRTINYLNYTFCSDKALLKLNKRHLNHDFYTDIITFDLTEHQDVIEGDIYISYERVKENARQYKAPVQDELARVLVHGLLHLCGYNDETETEKKEIRKKENYYLNLLKKENVPRGNGKK